MSDTLVYVAFLVLIVGLTCAVVFGVVYLTALPLAGWEKVWI